jgi:hypothetical protein
MSSRTGVSMSHAWHMISDDCSPSVPDQTVSSEGELRVRFVEHAGSKLFDAAQREWHRIGSAEAGGQAQRLHSLSSP